MWVEELNSKGGGNQGWQLLNMVTKRANPKYSNTGAQVRFTYASK